MTSSHFMQLLTAATSQAEPQQLLFLFAGAELPEDASAAQRARFEAGEGGALAPLMCVDKAPAELGSFEALAAEARQMGPAWSVVFVAGLSGQGGEPPSPSRVEQALNQMIEAVRRGEIGRFAAYDTQGQALGFE